ncbi:ketopantoate reductase PanE/ApbA-domain-containing protein [Melampsora americana]|nr:ketopantoate reductase PanE/ApbA-domain-containing protein [Melampsora americana]
MKTIFGFEFPKVGTGAVGAFYGSRLHQPSNVDRPVLVSLTCRSNYDQVSKNGLELKTNSFGDYHFEPHRVFNSVKSAVEEIKTPKWDFVLLCTKVLPDQIDDSEILLPLFSNPSARSASTPTIVLIQNGVGIEEIHRNRFKDVPIISCVTVVNVEQIKPNLIRQNKWTRICIGPFIKFKYDGKNSIDHQSNQDNQNQNQNQDQELIEKSKIQVNLLSDLFKQGGIKDVEVYNERELQLVRWHKLAINASMNPSSILSGGLTNSEMVKDPVMRIHLIGCMNEILRAICVIFEIERIPNHLASVEEILNSINRTKTHLIKPSMLTDWEQNRPLEIQSILAMPIRIAKRFGIELNRLQSMYAFLNQLERKRSRSLKL